MDLTRTGYCYISSPMSTDRNRDCSENPELENLENSRNHHQEASSDAGDSETAAHKDRMSWRVVQTQNQHCHRAI